MEIVLASRNKHKINELNALIKKKIDSITVLSLDDIGFVGEIEETGETFEENAMIKAKAVARLGYIGVGDDSGLAVDALGGAPGVYSARYAGEHGDDEKNNAKLLFELSDIEDRGAAFVCVIACAFPDELNKDDFCVRGECRGEILHEKCGNSGFGYDPLFYYAPLNKSFAELSGEEKNSVSHRGRAIELFADKIALLNNQ